MSSYTLGYTRKRLIRGRGISPRAHDKNDHRSICTCSRGAGAGGQGDWSSQADEGYMRRSQVGFVVACEAFAPVSCHVQLQVALSGLSGPFFEQLGCVWIAGQLDRRLSIVVRVVVRYTCCAVTSETSRTLRELCVLGHASNDAPAFRNASMVSVWRCSWPQQARCIPMKPSLCLPSMSKPCSLRIGTRSARPWKPTP